MKQNYKAKPSELRQHVPGRAFAFFAANVMRKLAENDEIKQKRPERNIHQ